MDDEQAVEMGAKGAYFALCDVMEESANWYGGPYLDALYDATQTDVRAAIREACKLRGVR